MVIKMLEKDRSLVMTTKSVLHQRESAIENISFLIPAIYNDQDMTDLNYYAMWRDPANEAHIEALSADDDLRDNKWIVLHMSIKSKFTKMAGTNILMITGSSVTEETDTNIVLETGEIDIKVEPVNDFFAFVSDNALSPISEQLANLRIQTDKLAILQEQINQDMATDISYTENGHLNLIDESGYAMGEGVDVLYSPIFDKTDDGVFDLDDIDEDEQLPSDDIAFIDLD